MTPFIHKNVKGLKVRYKAVGSGGYVSDTLIVITDIPVLYGRPGYDTDAFNEMLTAVILYCKSHGDPYVSIEFEAP